VFIQWDKDFLGKEAAHKEREAGPEKRLIMMTVDIDGRDVVNDEAILKDGKVVGYVSSGGYAHHVSKSMAMGYVPTELAQNGTALEIEINGDFYPATVVAHPVYDAGGSRMRG